MTGEKSSTESVSDEFFGINCFHLLQYLGNADEEASSGTDLLFDVTVHIILFTLFF